MGKPYAVHRNDVSPMRIEVARRVAEADTATGGGPVPATVRARIRTQVARELFTAEHDRPPASEQGLAGFVAQHMRPRTTAVAGYDLTFSPVKSVSTLWAVADPHTARMIEPAHQFAVAGALKFIEDHALYTRTGAAGARQVQVTGLVAATFTHRDSRAGDPDLHTHVTVHGSERCTSARILAAEHRLLAHASETGAPVVPEAHGRLAILEATANGTPLNRGQAALVQDMATSGRRVQLASVLPRELRSRPVG